MREKEAFRRQSAVRTGTVSQASTGETVAMSLVISVAFTCLAIGAWSMLSFFSGVGSFGVTGIISGFLRAVTGQ